MILKILDAETKEKFHTEIKTLIVKLKESIGTRPAKIRHFFNT